MEYITNIDGFILRDATEEDCAEILNLIKAIATYEKMLDEVTASVDSLRESLFIKKRAQVLLAIYNNKIVGYMLYFFNYSTFTGGANLYLEDLFLYEEYRHKGFGRMMFEVLAKIAIKEKAKRIDWVCLDWNTPGRNFYKSIGAQALDMWVLHRLDEKQIAKLANEGN